MKTQEELNVLKEEFETLNRKLHELTEEELEQVSGGGAIGRVKGDDIAKLNTTNAVEALQSRVAGAMVIGTQAQPGSGSSIKLK